MDSLFQVVGTFYIGWEQTTDNLLNIGMDKNLHANEYMHYNVGAGWNNSQFLGSWMMRPILSQKTLPLIVNEKKPIFSIYPNPVHSQLYVESEGEGCSLSIYNIQGSIVKQVCLKNRLVTIPVSNLSPSLYIIELSSREGKSYQKLLVR